MRSEQQQNPLKQVQLPYAAASIYWVQNIFTFTSQLSTIYRQCWKIRADLNGESTEQHWVSIKNTLLLPAPTKFMWIFKALDYTECIISLPSKMQPTMMRQWLSSVQKSLERKVIYLCIKWDGLSKRMPHLVGMHPCTSDQALLGSRVCWSFARDPRTLLYICHHAEHKGERSVSCNALLASLGQEPGIGAGGSLLK